MFYEVKAMQKKIFVRVIAVLLALLLVGSVIFGIISSVNASAAPSQGEIDALKDEKEELEQKKNEIQSQINSLEYEQASILQKKAILDEQIDLTLQEIENISEQIEVYNSLIAEKVVEVEKAEKAEAKQWDLYKTRIRAMEEGGSVTYLAVLFDATSFSDLLARIDFIGKVMRYDEELYEQLVAARLATIEAKKALEAAKEEQEQKKKEQEEKEAELENQMAEANAFLAEVEADLELYETLFAETEEERLAIDAEIQQKEKELEEWQNNQSSAGIVGSGSLIWPAPASRIITSEFGTRFHPIYYEYRTHYGVDIGAGYGTEVLAADSGTVITSEYSSSYGNYIVISHGNGMTTLYAHISTRYASVGDSVYAGEVIGLVGSTGASTGPHLHFEVSINGSRVNPLNYFSGYVIQ